jgi:hypothetical protein
VHLGHLQQGKLDKKKINHQNSVLDLLGLPFLSRRDGSTEK